MNIISKTMTNLASKCNPKFELNYKIKKKIITMTKLIKHSEKKEIQVHLIYVFRCNLIANFKTNMNCFWWLIYHLFMFEILLMNGLDSIRPSMF